MSIFPLHQWLCCILCRSLFGLFASVTSLLILIATTQYPYVTCAYLSFLQVRIKVFLYAMQDVWLLFLAVKINFLLIRLTKQIALSYFRCWFPILFADTGKSWSTDSQAKRKLLGTRYKFFTWYESTRLVSYQWKRCTPSHTILNCYIYSLATIHFLRVYPALFE